METITYRNVLKPEKTRADYQRWLKKYWPDQKKWGAVSYRIWAPDTVPGPVLFCRYVVNDIEEWNHKVTTSEAKSCFQDLGKIVYLNRTSFTITLTPAETA